MPSRLTLQVPNDFLLFTAVCSYGHFLLAPTYWDRDTQQLHRPLRDTRGRVVRCRIVQRRVANKWQGSPLTIHCNRRLDRPNQAHIKAQVVRMLRIDEDFSPWYRLHPKAKRRSFARLFRGADLFEDMVKTITSCNVTWPNTVNMNRLLVERVGDGAFPTPEQVADFGEDRLKTRCRVGYRAGRIVQLARGILDGSIDLAAFEDDELSSDACYDMALKLYGIGPYAAANICMLLGHYDRLAIDTETYRHYCKTHRVRRPKDPVKLHKRIAKYYGQFDPYPFLAYWFELWEGYEDKFGRSHHWDAEADAKQFTASNL